ncbi:MAG: phenylalanine--tRNA ligase subunit beta [Crocinitomicaceae bacterium]|nr:phenylalanine--tRNA ligase subunit beta [Crocinitomicaceae bacterium]
MKISLNWLKDYIKIELSPERVAEILTDTGLEVENLEKVETVRGGLEGVVIGKVLTKEKHPDADRLNVTTVDVGNGDPLQIVCGAPNVEIGQKVAVATVGTTLYPNPDEPFKIKKSKIRGVESVGMICAEDELGLGEDHDGIMVLDPESEIGTPAKEFFEIEDDYLIEIGLTPNRSDAMGHIGVARDLKAYLNYHEKAELQICHPSTEIPAEGDESIEIEIKDKQGAPRYAGAVITGVKVEPSPAWLQNRLRVIGLNPINNIVDITNYVMHECGNPLHAFDLENVGNKIVVRRAKYKEKLVTLDDTERELDTDDLMICNEKEAMCIAGTFGGAESGVKDTTTALFLEAAYFDPVSVRKTAKRHILNTDSSFRFERGVDPNGVDFALKRAINLILDIAGGKLGKVSDIYPAPIKEKEVLFVPERSKKLMGIDISDEDMSTILNELDIAIISDDAEELVLSIPAYRVDVTREADVTEELLRIYGFNNVPLPDKLNASLTYRPEDNNEKVYNLIADYLVDQGFYEIMNNSLSSSKVWEQIKTSSFDPKRDVKILNPLSEELDVMRQTLLFGGLKSIEYNQNRQHPNVKFFEFGSDYRFNTDHEERYPERKKLNLWVSGLKKEENWTSDGKQVDFFYLKGIVEGILYKLGIFKNPQMGAILNDIFEDGMTYSIAKKSLVEIGWVRRDILDAFNIKNEVFYATIDWHVVEQICIMNRIKSTDLPRTQFVRRDFSLLLNNKVLFSEIRNLALSVDNKILKKVGLFDVYEGKNLPKGKKSYAVNFIFQDEQKTLKDKQIDAIMDKIREKLEQDLKAELR